MITIQLKTFLALHAPLKPSVLLPPEAGTALCHLIRPHLLAGQAVTLDFHGVKGFRMPFLCAAIGDLLEAISPRILRHLLLFINISEQDRRIVDLVIRQAALYHRISRKPQASHPLVDPSKTDGHHTY